MGRPFGGRLARERSRGPDLRYTQLAENHFASSVPNRIAKEELGDRMPDATLAGLDPGPK
jgi:hypothetical protein